MKLIERHKNIHFDEPNHIYTNKTTKKKYTSVTTFLGQFHEKFDAEKVSTRMSKGCNITKGRLKCEWACSAPIGSYVHYLLELFLIDLQNGKDFDSNYLIYLADIDEPYKNQFTEGVKIIEHYLVKGWEILKPELVMYSDKYGICGTADLIMINKNHEIAILDWKTSTKISTNSYDKKFYKPINDLDNSKFNKYSLQLNVYKRMIEDCGNDFKVVEMALLWLPKGNKGEILKVNNLDKEVGLILNK